jgi:AcrR family transcriptional regulator
MKAAAAVTPRKQPRQARAQATIEAILEAAAQLLVDDGVEAASTNRIAERAGVSVGSLYQYFPSKEAVLFALVDRHVASMQKLLDEKGETLLGSPLEEGVAAYVTAMFEAHRLAPKLHRVLFEQLTKLAGREVLQRWSDDAEASVRLYLEHHRDRLAPKDLDMAAFLLVTAVEAVSYKVSVFRPRYLELRALAEQVTALVLGYLLG